MTDLGSRVETLIREGLTKEEVYLKLLGEGLKVAAIEAAFQSFESPATARAGLSSATPVPGGDKIGAADAARGGIVTVLVRIGVILVAVGIFSFIAANWAEMTDFVRLAIIILAMLGSYFGGGLLWDKAPRSAMGLIFLGTLIYGAGIFLIAQMFNIRANWPDGFILWMFGALAMALAFRSNKFYLLGLILGLISVIGYPSSIFELLFDGPMIVSSKFLTSAVLLVLATLSCLSLGYIRRREVLTLEGSTNH